MTDDAGAWERLDVLASELVRKARKRDGPVAVVAERAAAQIFELAAGLATPRPARRAGDFLASIADFLRAPEESAQDGLSTGFRDLDFVLGGLRAGDLVAVGGDPSVGKTSFVLNVACNLALAGAPTLVVSMGIASSDLVFNLISSIGRLDAFRVRSGVLGTDENRDAEKAMERIASLPLFLDDSPGSIAEALAAARRAHRDHDICAVVVDSASRLGPDRGATVVAMHALERLAGEMNVPIIATVPLRHDRDLTVNGGCPRLADVRHADVVEDEATAVVLLHREDAVQRRRGVPAEEIPDAARKYAALIVARDRRGLTGGLVELRYFREQFRFEDIEHAQRSGPRTCSDPRC